MNSNSIKNILILGGGTAGWMTANLMAEKWKGKEFSITVVESSEIGIIGVGEGSTPKLKDFFDSLNIPESEWMPACNATYKNGIKFENWSTVKGFESYFHPFGCTLDALTYKLFRKNALLRNKGADVECHPDKFFLMSELAKNELAPKASKNFPFEFHYSYHFDSGLLGEFLKKKAFDKGVKRVEGKVTSVQLNDVGNISSIKLNDERELEACFFVDCSGFNSLLMQKALKVPFISFSENLFNDAAIAIPTELNEKIPSQTISKALTNGWSWQIPLTNRFGNGYVYSTSYCTPDEAETELRQDLGLLESDVEARHLKMKVGRVAKSWYRNCVSIGLSQGFIEPLEATALQFVYTSIEEFMNAFEAGDFTNKHQDVFNKRMNDNFEGIRDYIVLHYKTNSRKDSRYWIDNQNNTNISNNVEQMLKSWNNGEAIEQTLNRLDIAKYYTSISWSCLLAGVGVFKKYDRLLPANELVDQADLQYLANFFEGCSLNFEKHHQYLKNLRIKSI